MTTPTWNEFAELALKRVRASGAEYGDIRIQHSTSQTVSGEDQRVSSVRDGEDAGFGVRVLYHGGWGFAASSILSPEEVPRVADLAVEIAKGSASVAIEKVRLAQEPVHQDRIVTPRRVDPFTVPLEKKADLVLRTMEALHRQPGIVRSSADCGRAGTASCLCPPRVRTSTTISSPCRETFPPRGCATAGSRRGALIPRICVPAMN